MVEKKDLLAFTFGWRLGFPGSSAGKNLPAMQETLVQVLGLEVPRRRDRPPTPVFLGSHGGSDDKESAWNAGELGSILGRSPGGGQGNPLQYSCPENPRERGALSY